jgi:hypothetical protein
VEKISSFRYRNIIFTAIGVILAIILSAYPPLHKFLLNIVALGFLGAFLAGMLFVSTFTVAIGAVVLFMLAEHLSPIEVGLIAGLGAVFGDLTIFRFVKDDLIVEIEPIYEHFGGNHLTKIMHTKYFRWTLPVVGAIIIASPLPDELGITLMGIANIKTYKFIIMSFILNSVGIFLVITATQITK